jgi:hypothetical protein
MSSQSSDTLGIYLREIGRIDRLLPEQEIFYARLVRSMLALEQQKNLLVQRLKRSPNGSELNGTKKSQNPCGLSSLQKIS